MHNMGSRAKNCAVIVQDLYPDPRQQSKTYKKYLRERKKEEGGKSIDNRFLRILILSKVHKVLVKWFPQQNNCYEVVIMQFNVCNQYKNQRIKGLNVLQCKCM